MRNPESFEHMFEVAIALRNQGQLEMAVEQFLKIISIHPDHENIGGVFTTLAGVYTDLNDYTNSLENFKKGTEINPESELASLGLYVSYAELGKHREAIRELLRYLEKYPAKVYKITLKELLKGLTKGYMLNHRDAIEQLAKKNGLMVK